MEDLNVFTITAAIADPVRLSAMLYLMPGPASVTEIMNHLEVSQSNLSNHLGMLKNAGLIKSRPAGRQKIYELANHEVAQLIELLFNMQHTNGVKIKRTVKPIQNARTCYDHLAGRFGVALFKKLVEKNAIKIPDETADNGRQFFSEELLLGTDAGLVFGKLGIDLASLKNTRRKFAFGCLDWTERTPHLAGALGASICQSFLEKKWIARKSGTRAITVTSSGRLALKDLIGLNID